MSKLLKDTLERAGKTFLQFYLGSWMLSAGLLSTNDTQPKSSTFNLLFTTDNLKAAAVGLALSLATSVGSSRIGNKDNASVVNE